MGEQAPGRHSRRGWSVSGHLGEAATTASWSVEQFLLGMCRPRPDPEPPLRWPGEDMLMVLLIIAPPSQELEPPAIPGGSAYGSTSRVETLGNSGTAH